MTLEENDLVVWKVKIFWFVDFYNNEIEGKFDSIF